MTVKKYARQGDLLFVKHDKKVTGLKKAQDMIVAHGEVTGHSHQVAENDGVAVLENEKGDKFVESQTEWQVVHDEHGPISFGEGFWEVRRQREYSPEAIRRVVD